MSVSVVAGLLLACSTLLQLHHTGAWIQANDFTYPWFGAREILAGRDPYVTIRQAHLPWGPYLFYPAPAFLLALPFAWLPAQFAAAAFIGCSAALLAFVLARGPLWRLGLFVSAPMLVAANSVQWSPLLMAASLAVPAIGLLVAKPNLAVPLMAMQTQWRAWGYATAGGFALIALSLVVLPHWISEWRAAMQAGVHDYPILVRTPLGAVLSVALLRWRQPEARLLLVMACIPQKMLFYDQLPLLLIPDTRREMQWAVLLSLVALGLAFRESWRPPAEYAHAMQIAVTLGVYWPALVMVLRRPNRA